MSDIRTFFKTSVTNSLANSELPSSSATTATAENQISGSATSSASAVASSSSTSSEKRPSEILDYNASSPSTVSKKRKVEEDTSKSTSSVRFYKGCKCNVVWLKSTYPCLVPVKLGKKNALKCTLCHDNIVEAKQAARNGQVPMADGVRCDEAKAIDRIIDHLSSEVHAAAERADKAKKLWERQSDEHPWVKVNIILYYIIFRAI